jgi:predicted KAP-like P-loop ATPase
MWLDNASNIDYLFYEPYAEIISNIVNDQNNTPTTIGVFGLWGAGKSTLLNLIDKKLESDKSDSNTLVINVNAWMFEGYEDAKIALMQCLLGELENRDKVSSFKTKIKSLIKRINFLKIASSALTTGIAIASSAATGDPGFAAMAVARDAKDVVEFANEVKESITAEEVVKNITDFKKEFECLLNESNVNVVVIVDDLDRCSPERIIETLEAIKLFLSVKNTSFIIAADDNVIKYAIRKKYPKMEDMDVELSEEYIEKIIQIPIYIPDLSTKDIENYLLLLITQNHFNADQFKQIVEKVYEKGLITKTDRITVDQLFEICRELNFNYEENTQLSDDFSVIDNIRNIVSTTLKGNPRQAKRFLNTFITKRELAKMYYGDEIEPRILAKLLVLQKIDSELFRELNEWNKDYQTENEEFKKVVENVGTPEFKNNYKRWSTPNVVKWIECEPKDLYKQRLDKYFYLTREHLRTNGTGTDNASEKAKDFIDRISVSNEGTIKNIVSEMKSLNADDIKSIFSVILSAFKKGNIDYFVISALFSEFDDYRQEIATVIISKDEKLGMGDINYMQTMYLKDNNVIDDVLKTLQQKNKITVELAKRIRGEK